MHVNDPSKFIPYIEISNDASSTWLDWQRIFRCYGLQYLGYLPERNKYAGYIHVITRNDGWNLFINKSGPSREERNGSSSIYSFSILHKDCPDYQKYLTIDMNGILKR